MITDGLGNVYDPVDLLYFGLVVRPEEPFSPLQTYQNYLNSYFIEKPTEERFREHLVNKVGITENAIDSFIRGFKFAGITATSIDQEVYHLGTGFFVGLGLTTPDVANEAEQYAREFDMLPDRKTVGHFSLGNWLSLIHI